MPSRIPPVARFVVAAFAVSWIGGVASHTLLARWAEAGLGPWRSFFITLPSTWGPALAAGAVTLSSYGRAGLVDLLRKVRPRRGDVRWILLLPLLGTLVTWLAFALSGTMLPLGAASGLTPGFLVQIFGAQLLVVGIGEELGWRGWLLPNLAKGRSLLSATALTGAIVLLWHLPKLLGPLAVTVPLVVLVLSSAFLIGFLWTRVSGTIAVPAIAHVSINTPVYWVEWSGALTQQDLLAGWAFLSGLYALLCTGLLLTCWPTWRAEFRAFPD